MYHESEFYTFRYPLGVYAYTDNTTAYAMVHIAKPALVHPIRIFRLPIVVRILLNIIESNNLC